MKFEYEQKDGHGEIYLTREGYNRRHVQIVRVDCPRVQELIRSAVTIMEGMEHVRTGR